MPENVICLLLRDRLLALKNEQTKVTIALSSESVAFFKEAAKKLHAQYQTIIRQLLDEYVAQQKQRRYMP